MTPRWPPNSPCGLTVRSLSAWRLFAWSPALAPLFVAAVLSLAAPVIAAPPPSSSPFVPSVKPSLEIHRAAGPIRVDGELDDPGWKGAARATNFSETFPGSMRRPPATTDVLLTYDQSNLYIAFIAQDPDPASIRAALRERDAIFDDDYIGIILDTFGDGRSAYEIFVNPLGCQGDLLMSGVTGDEDQGFDLVFESKGRLTPAGYQVELAIPFRSLRFPDHPEQSWRATFWRTRPRENRETSAWAATSRDEPCFICQFGTLTGMRDIAPGGNLALIPAVLGSQAGALSDPSDPSLGWHNDRPGGQLSLTGRYAVTSNLTAEATLNPDFSQIESDAGQIDVNTTFGLNFAERRPFFQEGSDLLNTYMNAVYTRALNDPDAAVKLTGQSGPVSIAWLAARDHHSPIILPFPEQSEELLGGRSTSNILRVRRSVHGDSHLGFLATDRRLDGGGSGSLAGVDGSLRFQRNYTLRGQFLVSRTHEPVDSALTAGVSETTFDHGRHTSAFDGETYGGYALYAAARRDARHLSSHLDFDEYGPTFRTDLGQQRQNNIRRIESWSGLTFYPSSPWVSRIQPQFDYGRVWNFDGLHKDGWIIPSLYGQLQWQTSVNASYLWSSERFHDIFFPGIRRGELNVQSVFNRDLTAGFDITRGRFIARRLGTPVLGRGTNASVWATLRPAGRLVVEPTLSYAELHYPGTGQTIFDGYILRSRFSLQCTRELSVRLVAQYDDFAGEFAVEPLLTYRVNPLTVLYLGSNYNLDDFSRSGDLRQASRQFFFKIQYLFQM